PGFRAACGHDRARACFRRRDGRRERRLRGQSSHRGGGSRVLEGVPRIDGDMTMTRRVGLKGVYARLRRAMGARQTMYRLSVRSVAYAVPTGTRAQLRSGGHGAALIMWRGDTL